MSRKTRHSGTCSIAVLGFAVLVMPARSISMDTEFAGQLNLRGAFEDPDCSESIELRLMPQFQKGRHHKAIVHYEAVAMKDPLYQSMDNGAGFFLAGTGVPDDRRRVFDLTHTVTRKQDSVAYHRLDRLVYNYSAGWGTLTIGRSAITWGNGLVFNPMDLFNPFAPTDVERDYKIGDDLVLLTLFPADWNRQIEWQVLAVPRRSISSGSMHTGESSLAIKAHLLAGEAEWDFLAAWHYDEGVVGMGRIGYIGDAVWRLDATLNSSADHYYFSTVANIDYSWTWSGTNYYGSVEFHYNNLGSSDCSEIILTSDLIERLLRGEVYTLGRAYMAPSLQVELHPLVNLHFAAIINLGDPSAVLLPRLVWSARQNVDVTLGANLYAGGRGTEFGGFPVPGDTSFPEAADSLYLWVKAFF